MSTLHDIALVDGSVDVSATFAEAAAALSASRLAALAVVDEGRVVGLFTDEELLLGISPRYLDELRHTAFLETELPSLRERARDVREEPVRKHMRRPITIELEGSSMHAAERFVHCDEGALPVVDDHDRFVGMLSRTEFAHALLKRLSEGA
ncbi:MAG TPA: CBS domain-containing protein [Gaiellaceae bacterium]|nr:CBS domain-containing protein [Gaiellaceae bacterium]